MGGPGMLSCASSPRSLVLSGCGEPSGGHLPMSWQLLTLLRREDEKQGQSCSLERSLTGWGAGRGTGKVGRSRRPCPRAGTGEPRRSLVTSHLAVVA